MSGKVKALQRVAQRVPGLLEDAAGNFKRWFGDSKAVDPQGKPLDVYTATNKDFTEFKPNDGIAAWVSTTPEFANKYAKAKFGYWKTQNVPWEKDGFVPEGVNVIKANINPQRPFDATGLIKNLAAPMDPAEAQAVAAALGVRADELLGAIPKTKRFPTGEEYPYRPIGADLVRTPFANNAARAAGFDSVKATEAGDTVYALFNPTQIKSAFNRGTYSPKDPNILNSIMAAPLPFLLDEEGLR